MMQLSLVSYNPLTRLFPICTFYMGHTHSSIKEIILKFDPAPTDSMESRFSGVQAPLSGPNVVARGLMTQANG